MTEEIIELIAGVGIPGVYFVVLALAFADTAVLADLVVPGEVGLVVAGAAVEREGVLWLAVAAGATGAVIGDSVSFFLGRRFGVRLVCRWKWTRRKLLPALERAHAHFERRGGPAVFIGRWVGALRALVGLVAGASGMPYRRFLPWNVAASVSWVGAVVSLGYFFGGRVARLVDRYALVVSVVVVAGLIVWWVSRRLRKTEAKEATWRRSKICDDSEEPNRGSWSSPSPEATARSSRRW